MDKATLKPLDGSPVVRRRLKPVNAVEPGMDTGLLSDAMFRILFERAPANLLVLTPTFKIVAASDWFVSMTSTSRSSLVGMGLFDVFPDNPTDPEANGVDSLRSSLERVIRFGLSETMPLQRYDIPSISQQLAFETRYWRPINTPILDENGSVQLVIHSSVDVTEIVNLKKANGEWEETAKQFQGRSDEMEAKISQQGAQATVLAQQKILDRVFDQAKENRLHNESEQRFSSLLEIAPDAMVVVDVDGTIMFFNSKTQNLFGYKREELMGKKVDVLMPLRFRVKHLSLLERFFSAPSTRTMGLGSELFGLRKDGTEFPFEVSLSPLETPTGTLTISAIRDLTERKNLDIQRIRAQRLESIGTFAGNIAHDMNNALAPILMSLELLRIQNPGSSELISMIEAGANRGAEMLRQLLVFSKGSFIEPKAIPSITTMNDIHEFVRGTFPQNIQIQTEVGENLWEVSGDPTQIHQALVNLCVNSRDSMPEGGTLTLRVENVEVNADFANANPGSTPGNHVKWSVSDTGSGIAPEMLDRIFEPFFSTKGHNKGTGLGLSIVIGISKSHHGFVVAHTIPGKGSVFSMYLPASKLPSKDSMADPPTKVEMYGTGKTVLVVDDVEGMREALRSVLESIDFTVITACDGEDALSVVVERRSELIAVITDVHMPKMDGVTFVRILRNILPDIGIVVISGNLDEDEAGRFMKMNVLTFLDKPFTQEKLTRALSQVIAR